uniref:C2H2-type domain-containing protein n=1 Tax=Biomphalaria glabrata TaxID=6526 RepID=A0A2C9LI71_BIOGL
MLYALVQMLKRVYGILLELQVQFIEKDEVMTSENYELAENMQDQLEEYHHREQVLRKEINFQKSFQCQICLKEFSQSSHLKNHQLSHTVLKNIKMLICQRGFSTSSEMKRHKLAYTGEENDNLSKVTRPKGCFKTSTSLGILSR